MSAASAASITIGIAVTFLMLAVIGAIDVIHAINVLIEHEFAKVLHWGCLP
jgi:hypothetical protein